LAAFNYTYTFFSGTFATNEPAMLKIVKDLFVVSLLANYLTKSMLSGRLGIFKSRILIPISIFLLYLLLLFLYSFGQAGIPLVSLRFFLLYPLLIFVAARGLNSMDKITKYFKLFLNLGLVIAVIAILQSVFNLGNNVYSRYIIIFGLAPGRATATLGNPNNLAQFLAIVFLCCWGFRSKPAREKLNLKYFSFYPIVLFVGVLLTFSRTAFAFLIIVVNFAFLFQKRISKKALRIFVIVFLISLVVFSLFFASRGGLKNLLDDQRIPMYAETFSGIITGNFRLLFFGFSMANSNVSGDQLAQVLAGNDVANPYTAVADSLYVSIFNFAGIIGLFIFVISILYFMKSGLKLYSKTEDPFVKGAAFSIVLVIIFLLLSGIFIANLVLFPSAFYFWIFIGILLNLIRIEKNKRVGEING